MRPALRAPRFLARLAAPEIRTVMIAGGGGFDVVHGLLRVPGLARLGKSDAAPGAVTGSARMVR